MIGANEDEFLRCNAGKMKLSHEIIYRIKLPRSCDVANSEGKAESQMRKRDWVIPVEFNR
jgi:hypothetical protein